MTQFQFDLIKKIIGNGAPALASELCSVLDSLVQDYAALNAENDELKARIEELTAKCEDEKSED